MGLPPDARGVSYLHCPVCHCAYNIATQPRCPRCVQAAEAGEACPAGGHREISSSITMDAADAIVAAIEQLAHAMSSASPDEMARVHAQLAQRRSLPAPIEGSEPTLAIVLDSPRPVEHRFASVTRRLRSWTRARLTAPMQRARALLARAA